jgi:hypothetical protein
MSELDCFLIGASCGVIFWFLVFAIWFYRFYKNFWDYWD